MSGPQLITTCLLAASCYLLPTIYYLLPATYYLLPTTYYPLPATCYLLPIADYGTNYLPPTTHCLPQVSGPQLITTYVARAVSIERRSKVMMYE